MKFPLSKAAFVRYLKTSTVKYKKGQTHSRGKCPIEYAILATLPRQKFLMRDYVTGRKKTNVSANMTAVSIGKETFYRADSENKLPEWVTDFISDWDNRGIDDSNDPRKYLN